MNSSACARAAAIRISSSVASGLPTRRLSAIERFEQQSLLNTTPMFRRSAVSVRPRTSMPSILMKPDCGSKRAMQQCDGGRLAGAGRTDQSDGLAGQRG